MINCGNDKVGWKSRGWRWGKDTKFAEPRTVKTLTPTSPQEWEILRPGPEKLLYLELLRVRYNPGKLCPLESPRKLIRFPHLNYFV